MKTPVTHLTRQAPLVHNNHCVHVYLDVYILSLHVLLEHARL